jgi:hypothetical protein
MERDFKDLQEELRKEVLNYLVKQHIDLSNNNQINIALEDFYSDTIVEYMDKHGLELGYEVSIADDNNIKVDIWQW